MTIISTDKIEEAKKMIRQAEKPIIVKAQDVEFNRKILEYGRFDVLFSPESLQGKRSLRSIDSGLDYVMAKAASKNKISIGIDFATLQNVDKKEKAFILTKIKQNIEICRKAGAKIKAIGYSDKRDVFALLLSLGASTQQAKEAVE